VTTREAAIAAAADDFVTALDTADHMTVEQLVDAAWTPTGPSRDDLADRIRADRAARGLTRHETPPASPVRQGHAVGA
jgi:hypothetical protein